MLVKNAENKARKDTRVGKIYNSWAWWSWAMFLRSWKRDMKSLSGLLMEGAMPDSLMPGHFSSIPIRADAGDFYCYWWHLSLNYATSMKVHSVFRKRREGVPVLQQPTPDQLSPQSSRNPLLQMSFYHPELINSLDTPKRWRLKHCQSQNEITDRRFSPYHQWVSQGLWWNTNYDLNVWGLKRKRQDMQESVPTRAAETH